MPAFGDVVMMLQPSTYGPFHGQETELMCTQAALYVALASCARIGKTEAAGITLAEAKSGVLMLPDRMGKPRPIPLLPVIMKLIEKCEKKRPDDAYPWLFVTCEGNRLPAQVLWDMIKRLGRRYGFRAYGMQTRLFEFYDSFFADHDRQDVVAVLSRTKRDDHGPNTWDSKLDAAAADQDLLHKVQQAHGLSGPAGRWVGGHGIKTAAETMRLFGARRPLGFGRSEALKTDPVCRMLLSRAWSERGQLPQRENLAERYFEHTDALVVAGRLNIVDQAFLFHSKPHWVRTRRRKLRVARMTEAQRGAEAVWTMALPELYLARPAGETIQEFVERMRPQAPEPELFTRVQLAGLLNRAGVLGRA